MDRGNIYLVLAVFGALVPYFFFVDYFASEGLGRQFIGALFVNGAAGGFTADLLITSLVFWIWMGADVHQGQGRRLPIWPFVLLNLAIGLSCALPAYLWKRERRAWSARQESVGVEIDLPR